MVLFYEPTVANQNNEILVQIGSIDPAVDGQLAVLHPYRDGTIIPLLPGDYNIAYSGNKILGYGVDGPFEIDEFGNREIVG